MSRMLKLKPPIRKPVIVLLLALLPSFFLLTFKGKMTDVSAHAGSTTLVIDPGHGGIDGGAQGADGSRESDINLAIALKLRALAEFYGQDNIMTRQDDSTKSDTPNYSEHRDLERRTEIVNEALRVLDKIAELYGHTFHYTDVDMGGCAIDKWGDPLPQEMLDKCVASDSVLLGAVGGDKWNDVPGPKRPEKGLLRLRAGMGVYSNNRPAKIWPQLAPASPLKPEIVAQGIDFIIVRELIGGVYFGNHETHTLENGEKQAVDTMPYAEHEIERIGRIGFETARKRRKKLCCVDKANVLDTSRLWRTVMHRLQAEYPDVEYSEMFVDNCAMQIVKNPAQFDVIVTENMFGDILSDEASMITGSIGMIPSSSLGDGTRGLYEPIHGSAPDIAGKDIVNPTACILSAAMMLRYSFGMAAEADAIENAVSRVLDKGLRTADNMSDGCTCLGCTAMGDAILAEL